MQLIDLIPIKQPSKTGKTIRRVSNEVWCAKFRDFLINSCHWMLIDENDPDWDIDYQVNHVGHPYYNMTPDNEFSWCILSHPSIPNICCVITIEYDIRDVLGVDDGDEMVYFCKYDTSNNSIDDIEVIKRISIDDMVEYELDTQNGLLIKDSFEALRIV